MLRRFREGFRNAFGGGGGGGFRLGRGGGTGGVGWPVVAGALVFGWLALGVYIVDEGERAVITRFGAYERTTLPGMGWHLPPPLEARRIIGVTNQQVIEIGYRPAPNGRTEDRPEESSMITGDRNIVDIDFRVVYRVSSAYHYLFRVRDPQEVVRGVAESTMREVIGQRELESILTTERASVEQAVETLTQNVLNTYEAGVEVLQVNLLAASAPPEVIEAFNDVVRAGQDAEAEINRATQFRNERVPQARGQAAQIVQQAEAYRDQVVREANGEAARFVLVYDQYRLAPRVTRERLYLETMERVYRDADTIILDQRGGAVPYLPLEMRRSNSGAQTTQPPRATTAPPTGGR